MSSILDELFGEIAEMQRRVREALPEEPSVQTAALPPADDPDTVLFDAADAALELHGADATLVTIFADGGMYAANGLADEEAVAFAIAPPPVGPHVRAMAIAYDVEAPEGKPAVQAGLAVPILEGRETIGFLSAYTRSPEVVFDEEQGWALQRIAAAVAQGLAALPAEAPAPVEPAAAPAAVPVRAPRSVPRAALLVVAALACVAAPLLMAADIHSPLRVAAALALMTLAPGAAVWPLFDSRSPQIELGLVVGTSLGISVLVAQATLWAGAWAPERSTAVLALVSLVSILGQLARQVVPPRVAWRQT